MKTFEKPLSAQEEKELLIKLREGDSVARNALIEKNMRLVAHIVNICCQMYRQRDSYAFPSG